MRCWYYCVSPWLITGNKDIESLDSRNKSGKKERIENQHVTFYGGKKWPEKYLEGEREPHTRLRIPGKEDNIVESLLSAGVKLSLEAEIWVVLPYARSGLATEWFSKRRWDSTASTVSRPKCSDENGSDSETTNQLLHIKQKLSYRILSCEFSVFAIRPIPYCGIDVYILCMFISCVCSLHWQTYGMHCTKI